MKNHRDSLNPGIEIAFLLAEAFASVAALVRDAASPLVSQSRQKPLLKAGLYATSIFLALGMLASFGAMTYPISRVIEAGNGGEPVMDQGKTIGVSMLVFLGAMACGLTGLGLTTALGESDEQ
jgi:hypothetical protein